MRRQLATGLRMTAALIVLTGLLYPIMVTGVAHAFFRDRAEGSLVKVGGRVIGSSLIAQSFTDAAGRPDHRYFQPRPSAAGKDGYDPTASGGSNLGPSNTKLLDAVSERVRAYRNLNGLSDRSPVPVDAVTASGSGLDPHVSLANAELQAPRVAGARHISVGVVLAAVHRHIEGRQWGFLGEKVVNVLELNLDLDRLR